MNTETPQEIQPTEGRLQDLRSELVELLFGSLEDIIEESDENQYPNLVVENLMKIKECELAKLMIEAAFEKRIPPEEAEERLLMKLSLIIHRETTKPPKKEKKVKTPKKQPILEESKE